jgi:hypothetical protein
MCHVRLRASVLGREGGQPFGPQVVLVFQVPRFFRITCIYARTYLRAATKRLESSTGKPTTNNQRPTTNNEPIGLPKVPIALTLLGKKKTTKVHHTSNSGKLSGDQLTT